MPDPSSAAATAAAPPAAAMDPDARPPVLIAQHVPTSLLNTYRQEAAAAQLKSGGAPPGQPPRRSPISPPGGLEPLPEASHVNALHAATGPAPHGLGSLDADIDAALNGLTPAQRAAAVSRSEGYDRIAVELTNERWKERWERLCLAAPEEDEQQQGANGHANGKGSKEAVPVIVGAAAKAGPSAAAAYKDADEENAHLREAEEWRKAPFFKRGEVNVTKLDETDGLVAFASPWLELDAADEGVRLDSEIALRQELQYAAYLGISHVILPPPSSDPVHKPFLVDYARAINACLVSGGVEGPAAGSWMQLSVRLPISSPYANAQNLLRQQKNGVPPSASGSSAASAGAAPAKVGVDDDWAWETWETIRHVCDYSPRLSIAMDLSVPLTSAASLARWSAEPVTSMVLPAASFLTNAKGFPVLSKACQSFMKAMLRRRPTVILAGTQSPPQQHTRGGPAAYLQYVRHLERNVPAESAVDTFARGYTDWLQAPLQPLMDHLEGQTYDVFERDPVKYALYEEAVFQALSDRPPSARTTSIWVCGAGRGPLVSRCLVAAERARRSVHVVAVEKNPGAVVTLQEKVLTEWGSDRVQIRFGDMRTMERPALEADRADIVVSELLGSFGDNELSPECLDGAMRFLKPTGISIPASYSPFLTPLSSPKLHAEVMNQGGSQAMALAPGSLTEKQLKAAETPYVVLFQAANHLAASGGRGNWEKIQECWLFEHAPVESSGTIRDEQDLPITNSHNVRGSSHTFYIPNAGVCHGLAGYFEAHLYGDVRMSIHPDPARASKDMLSWFPIFWPFKDPIYLPAGSELDVYMWRLSGSKRVWYEWCAEAYLPVPLVPSSTSLGSPATPSTGLGGAQPANSTGSAADVATPAAAGGDGVGALMLRGASTSSAASPSMGGAATVAGPNGTLLNRVKIGMTGLANPGGRSSWVGM